MVAVGVVILGLLLRLVSGGMLLLAGLSKLQLDTKVVIGDVRSYRLLPSVLLLPTTRLIPICEVTFAVTLLLGAMYPIGVILPAILFAIFTAALVISLLRGITEPCGCFRRSQPRSWRLVARNLFLLAIVTVIGLFDLDWPGLGAQPIVIQVLVASCVSISLCMAATLMKIRSTADRLLRQRVHRRTSRTRTMIWIDHLGRWRL